MSDSPNSLVDFSGTVRLFPLPNLVLYPCVVQPLHVFEPRYRQLLADALAGDRLMALALLKSGWEEGYHERPPIHPVVCIGRIFQEQRLSDGRYNLLLHGVARARVVVELPPTKPYRIARVEVLADAAVSSSPVEKALREELGRRMSGWLATQSVAEAQMEKLLNSGLPLGTLCDVFAFALPIDLELKQQLLGELDAERRTRRLLAQLETAPVESVPPDQRKFPPEFSTN
jgi:Lon protease-like protein